MAVREDILRIFPESMRSRWRRAAACGERLQEIRIRADRPILLYMEGKEYFLTFGGEVTGSPGGTGGAGGASVLCMQQLHVRL